MKIISWKIVMVSESGETIDVTDVPDDVAQVIDDYISDDIEGSQ